MAKWFFNDIGLLGSAGILVLRVVMGAAFIIHGWPKIQHATAWMGPDSPMPGWLQACAAAAEFGGGIALILGVFTRLAALGLAITMAVAVFHVHVPQGHPFVSAKGGPSFELGAIYLANSVALLLLGPGRIALDFTLMDLFRKRKTTQAM
jgi:putative oxidoreductase